MPSGDKYGITGKIAVTMEKPEKPFPISNVFGRSNFFLIFNSVDNSNTVLKNPYANELGGAGIQTSRLLIENKIDVVITKQIGMNPLRFLISANIKVYRSNEENALAALQLFLEGKLTSIENRNEYFPVGRMRKRFGQRRSFKNNLNKKQGNL